MEADPSLGKGDSIINKRAFDPRSTTVTDARTEQVELQRVPKNRTRNLLLSRTFIWKLQ